MTDAIIFIFSVAVMYSYGDVMAKKLDDIMPSEEKMVELMQEMQK